jgi:hypothetical protein
MRWSLQQINNPHNAAAVPGERIRTNGPAALSNLFVIVYNNQQHFSYLDSNNNIQDAWYDGSQWNLQQINYTDSYSLFVSVYNNQHHFAWLDKAGNIQDAWYDGSQWNLRQINSPGGVTNGPAALSNLFVTVYNNQQHFSYIDFNGNIQDAWYDGSQWNLRQINNSSNLTIPGELTATDGPSVGGPDFFVSVYNNQHHFVYTAEDFALQDAFYDGDANIWKLLQINNPAWPLTWPQTPPTATNGPQGSQPCYLFVSVYLNQQHFVYVDLFGNIHDAFYDGDANIWKLQQINNMSAPYIPGEYDNTTNGPYARLLFGSLFVSVYLDQQHFAYIDSNGNIQDAFYDRDTYMWNLQQINNSANPTIQGEYTATEAPVAGWTWTNLSVSVYLDQQHFAYIDSNGNIQDAWCEVSKAGDVGLRPRSRQAD